MARRSLPLAVLLAVALLAGDAAAREPTVVLLRPDHPTAVAAEAIVRLRGELLAAGYAVELADVPEPGGVRAAIATAARPTGADAVVALFGDGPQATGLLWVIDRASGKTITRPIPHDSEDTRGAQILSVRALELLRATFLEAALASPARAPAPKSSPAPTPAGRTGAAAANASASPAASPAGAESGAARSSGTGAGRESSWRPAATDQVAGRDAEARHAESRDARPRQAESDQVARTPAIARAAALPARVPARLALEAGGLVLGSLDGVPPAVLPLLRATLLPVEGWPLLARFTAAGLGTRSRLNGASGDAEVAHQLATVEALWAFRLGRRWQPFVSLGAGAAHLSAQGFAASGGAGRTAAAWAFVADAGIGLHFALSERLYLGGEVHAEGDAPYPSVRFAGTELATEGRPTILAALSFLVWL